MSRAKYRIEGEDATGAAFRSVLGNAKRTSDDIGKYFRMAFAGVSASAIIGFVGKSFEVGENLEIARKKARLTAEEMTSLAYAAQFSKVELDALSTGLGKMQIFLSKAAQGNKENVKTLGDLGLSIDRIKDLKADQQFELIAEQISRLREEEDQTRISTEIFSRAGQQMQPMFEMGAAGIRAAREEAVLLGKVLTEGQLADLSKADDAIDGLSASWDHFGTVLGGKVAPIVTDLLDNLSGRHLTTGTIDEQIKKLRVQGAMATVGPERRAEYEARIKELQDLKRSRSGRRGGDPSSSSALSTLGLEEMAAKSKEEEEAKKASDAAKKIRDAETKAEEKQLEDLWDLRDRLESDAQEQIFDDLDDVLEAELENVRIIEEAQKESQEQLAEYHREIDEERKEKQEELGLLLQDQFTDVFMRGKEGWKDMLKYWAAHLAMSGLDKLFSSMSNGGSGGGGGIGGFLSGLFGSGGSSAGGMGFAQGEWDWLGQIFGSGGGSIFGFAKGGRPPLDRPSIVGEAGPELFWPDGAGTVIPGGMGGSTVKFAPVYNIDARGASMDLAKALPKILRDNDDALEARIVQRLRKRHYGQL
jgi:hypothetical protein